MIFFVAPDVSLNNGLAHRLLIVRPHTQDANRFSLGTRVSGTQIRTSCESEMRGWLERIVGCQRLPTHVGFSHGKIIPSLTCTSAGHATSGIVKIVASWIPAAGFQPIGLN